MYDTIPVQMVFGATGKIGRALTRLLFDAGVRLVVAGRNEVALEELVLEHKAYPVTVDCRHPEEVEASVKRAVEHYGRIDGVACCVNLNLHKPLYLINDAEMYETVETCLNSAINVVRYVVPEMKKLGGSIVLISSAVTRIGTTDYEVFSAAKAGIEGLTRSAAASYAAKNIRVNAVAPGLIETKYSSAERRKDSRMRLLKKPSALGKTGTPEDVARMIEFLLDPQNSWITGQIIAVDGGYSSLHTGAGS